MGILKVSRFLLKLYMMKEGNQVIPLRNLEPRLTIQRRVNKKYGKPDPVNARLRGGNQQKQEGSIRELTKTLKEKNITLSTTNLMYARRFADKYPQRRANNNSNKGHGPTI